MQLDGGRLGVGERKGKLLVWRGKGNKDRVVPLNYEATQALHLCLTQRSDQDTLTIFTGKREAF